MIVLFHRQFSGDPIFINPAHVVTLERAWPPERTKVQLVIGPELTLDYPIEEVAKLLGYH